MGNVYVGVRNIARKVQKAYIGVSNKARKVQKAYIGVSNKARLVYQAEKMEFTEAEVNELIVYGKINQVPIGSTFTIANSQDTSRSVHTYVVIGKDHKDLNVTNYPSAKAATGTVDVWGTGAIAKRFFKSTSPYGYWNASDIRTWLNNTFYNGFNSTTKVHLKQMTVEYYYTTNTGNSTTMIAPGNFNTTDYVKLLSSREFNPSTYITGKYYMHMREGNGYEYFPSVAHDSQTSDGKKRFASATGTAGVDFQWRRSLHCFSSDSGNAVWQVTSNGNLASDSRGNGTYGIVPCFRLGA